MFPASTQNFFKKSLFWSWPLDYLAYQVSLLAGYFAKSAIFVIVCISGHKCCGEASDEYVDDDAWSFADSHWLHFCHNVKIKTLGM